MVHKARFNPGHATAMPLRTTAEPKPQMCGAYCGSLFPKSFPSAEGSPGSEHGTEDSLFDVLGSFVLSL